MGTTDDDTVDPQAEGEGLSPERRLDAIADLFAIALGRLVLERAAGEDQRLEMSPESTLIDGRSRAVMVDGASPRGAANGGRT